MIKPSLVSAFIFVEYKNMMQCPLIQVIPLYLQDLQDRFEEYIANQELIKQLELWKNIY